MSETGISQYLGHRIAYCEGALGTGPDGQFTVGIPQGGGVLRLDVALVNGAGPEGSFDDDIGLGKAFFQVSHFVPEMGGDIA